MKIKTKERKELDLDWLRRELNPLFNREIPMFSDLPRLHVIACGAALDLADALEAALSVPRRDDAVSWEAACEIGHGNADDGVSEGESIGWNNHADAVRKAVGVIE